MADLSLDEFIKKNNVQVRLSNVKSGQQRQGKFVQRTALVKNGRTQQSLPVFDARQKLGAKVAVADARDKIIINKRSGKGDARNKIVSNQVQKGQFDARSLIQRHRKTVPNPGAGSNNFQQTQGILPGDLALTRTLSNPNAKGKSQIQVTDTGLQITRPVPNTQVFMSNNSLQVTKRNRSYGNGAQPHSALPQKDFVPIIQIRNNRYRQPASAPPHSSQQYYREEPAYDQYLEPSDEYSPFPNPVPAFSNQRGYRDFDDPQYNAALVAAPDVPKFHVSDLRPIEAAGMRPVSYSSSSQLTRAPPGAATLSQGARIAGGARSGAQTLSQPIQAGVKRRQPAPPPPVHEVSGPLRLGKGGGPGIDLRPADAQHHGASIKKPKFASLMVEGAVQEDDNKDMISPLQGFRVVVTNLFTGVTQDDIIELFGAVGPLKKAKLLKAGTAEVVYVSKKDAISAVQKYHSRELDGQPMYVKMTTSESAIVKKAHGDHDPDITGEALRLYKKGTGIGSLPEAPIEVPTIHRALFKAGPPLPNKSVKFTVKI